MLTPQEFIEDFRRTGVYPSPMWCHALDLLAHVLKGDKKQTFFKDPDDNPNYLKELRSYLDGKPKEVDSFLEARHNDFTKERKWRRFDAEYGDLDMDRYIGGDRYPFDDYRKIQTMKPAVTIVIDMSIPYVERNRGDMAERHKKIYGYALQANAEGRPCRVVAACRQMINECPDQRWLLVLKDFEDPMFPSIWAAFEHNRLVNSFINSIQDYFVGTSHLGNGNHMDYNVAQDLDGEIILVEPIHRVTCTPE